MELIYSSEFLLHQTGGHPECPERLMAYKGVTDSKIPSGEQYLSLVHEESHINRVKQYCAESRPLDPDTLTSPGSFTAACAAVGAGILAAQQNGFALGRPPGHHSYPDRATGFCLFNSVAIATQYLINTGMKVLILDIDGHLGDGTSAIFYDSPDVLFCSLHQYPAFPGSGWVDEIGTGAGKGYTINIPMPPGSADDIFWQGMDFITPIIKSFNPDVVAVSAGFDGHQFDPLLQLEFSLECYHKCGLWLRENFKKTFAVLEGGYNLNVLPLAIDQFHRGINGLHPTHNEATTSSNDNVKNNFDRSLDQLHQQLKDPWDL